MYRDHHGWLRGLLRRRLGNACDAADLAQDVYLRLLRNGHMPPHGQQRRHLAQITNGLLIDLHRRRQLESAYLQALAQLPVAQQPSEESRMMALQTLLEVDAALSRLKPRARTALLLCKLEGLDYRSIAARLGVSVSSVEKYIASALLACCRAMP